MRVAVVDLGMGNLHSVAKGLAAAGADVDVVSAPAQARTHEALCVPGQGIFSRCVDRLGAAGWDEAMREWIDRGRPYFGICLGMQVLFDDSEETGHPGGGPSTGLGVIPGRVARLPSGVTVPHMGWNTVAANGTREYFYFDHSYACHPRDIATVAGWCEHGGRFAAWVRWGSVEAVQFHPEKSGRAGIALLKKWVEA
jgi:imidazole glycerol-phosphate synthase subunit HisH